MEPGLALGLAATTDVAIAGAYAYAGWLVASRARASASPAGVRLFAAWWIGIALTGLASATLAILAPRGAPLLVLDWIDQASLLTYATALVGFTSYLALLFLGTHRLTLPIAAAYAALVTWSHASAYAFPATGYTIRAMRPVLERSPQAWGPAPEVMALLLVLPVVIGIGAYATLLRRETDAARRYRITLVTTALVAWLLGVIVISLPALGDVLAGQAAGRFVVLASAACIVLAYRPPLTIRAWLGDADALRDGHDLRARRDARVQELV